MLHNISMPLVLISFMNNVFKQIFILCLIWKFLSITQVNAKDCSEYLDNAKVSIVDAATFVGTDGQLYVSEKAFVHGGKLLNTKKFQAPTLVTEIGVVGEADATITIDKFLHAGKYWKAQFSLSQNAIETVFVQTMPFPIVPGVMAGHVQARFKMKPGYEIQLIDPETNQVVQSIQDMIVSYEAALPVGESYNFALGAVDSSPLVGRIVSGQQKFDEGPERAFNQYKIPLSGIESATLLGFYLKNAIEVKMDYYYNTIIRNCTTTIFDGIDALSRFKSQIEAGTLSPFLTTIGGDPVIGPAINGLLDRFGNDLEQVQDMKDEYKGTLQSFGVPEKVTSDKLPFAPGGDDPMTLLVMTYGTENLTEEEKVVVKYVVDDIVNDLPETINMLLASAFSMVEDLQTSPKIIQAMLDVISKKLNQRIVELGDKIPNEGIRIQVQLTPYPSNDRGTDLRSKGLRAQLPFDIEQIDVLPNNKEQVLEALQKGIHSIDSHVDSDIPGFLKNFSVSILLKPENSKVKTQFLIGLQPLLKPMSVTNDQVLIDTVEIPKPDEYSKTYGQRIGEFFNALNPWAENKKEALPFVNLLLTHEQDLDQKGQVNPIARINFGSYGLVDEQGQLVIPQVADGKWVCWAGQSPHTPKLTGVLAEAPLGSSNFVTRFLNRILKGKEVTLAITDLEMNLQELNIKTTQVRVGAVGLRCLSLESVNKKFGEQANAKLQDLIKNVGPGIVLR